MVTSQTRMCASGRQAPSPTWPLHVRMPLARPSTTPHRCAPAPLSCREGEDAGAARARPLEVGHHVALQGEAGEGSGQQRAEAADWHPEEGPQVLYLWHDLGSQHMIMASACLLCVVAVCVFFRVVGVEVSASLWRTPKANVCCTAVFVTPTAGNDAMIR